MSQFDLHQADVDLNKVVSSAAGFCIDTRKARSSFDLTLSPALSVKINDGNLELAHEIFTTLTMGSGEDFVLRASSVKLVVDTGVRTEVLLRGNLDAHFSALRFEHRLAFLNGSSSLEMQLRITNTGAAVHEGGFWDLGDKGSVYIKEIATTITCDVQTAVIPENRETSISGGVNRDLPFEISSNESNIADAGHAADPLVVARGDSRQISISIKDFWKRFPASIRIERDQIKLSVLANTPNSPHELQGGETHYSAFSLSFGDVGDDLVPLSNKASPLLESKALESSGMIPWLGQVSESSSPLDKIIAEGIDGPHNFFWKREAIGEYGWRNFGDVWADHETLEHGNDDSLVSHYNNQYDLLAGMLTQFLKTRDDRWMELADDLAIHVANIDIYQTSEDRPEYNGGLFWHTDHYLPAATCTHRSFSREHMAVDHVAQSGGGPGNEHCYATGLVYHYLLTDDEVSAESARGLYRWMCVSMEGRGTVIERVWSFVQKDVKAMRQVLAGQKVLRHRYPFTRATGNYVNVILDMYVLDGQKTSLDEACSVIKNTFSANDDIAARGLDDIEKTWSYTVFLQSVARFLYYKSRCDDLDEHFVDVARSFLHYADWMLDSETPYLERAERLVYPNETWIAQDVRKAMISFVANELALEEPRYLEQAERYLDYVAGELSQDSVRKTSRLLAILMQSTGPEYKDEETGIKLSNDDRQMIALAELDDADAYASVGGIVWSFFKDIAKRMFTLSPREEYRWLKDRLG